MSWKAKLVTLENVQALSLALLFFSYLILALTTAQIHYLETIHRVTVENVFSQNLLGSSSADAVAAVGFFLFFIALAFRHNRVMRVLSIGLFFAAIAAAQVGSNWLVAVTLATVPVVAALAFYNIRQKPRQVMHLPAARKVGIAFLLVVVVLEIGALGRWVTYPIFPTEIYGDDSWRFAELESALFLSFGLLSPYLVVGIAFSFIYRWYVREPLRKIFHAFGHQDQSQKPAELSAKYSGIQESASNAEMPQSRSFDQSTPNSSVIAAVVSKPSVATTKQVHLMILSASPQATPRGRHCNF